VNLKVREGHVIKFRSPSLYTTTQMCVLIPDLKAHHFDMVIMAMNDHLENQIDDRWLKGSP
jgi:mitochondrial fission protein ELM1